MPVLTCNAGCEQERFHEGPCSPRSGFDSDLLTQAELAMLAPVHSSGSLMDFFLNPPPGNNVLPLLRTICNQRRAMKTC